MRFFRKERPDFVLILLRFAVGALFLWFGVDKWARPEAWYGWMPEWSWNILPIQPKTFLDLFGALEVAVGLCLAAGRLVRLAAVAAAAILLSVMAAAGINETTIRDSAVLGACVALFLAADAQSEKPLMKKRELIAAAAYIIFSFAVGLLYLKNG